MRLLATVLLVAAMALPLSGAQAASLPPIYSPNPGAITILLNPGHGGRFTGAVDYHMVEKNVNLNIALRLRDLLLSAGVHVVMTRTTDTAVNYPPIDVNGDGVVGEGDELAARIDIGNLARADVHVFNHLNGTRCHCVRGTKTFTGFARSFTPENMAFAADIQSETISQLRQFRSATYYPIDRGVKNGHAYYTLSPYDAFFRPRPSLMPAVLTESLYMSDPIENALLRRSDVRQAIATALYLGIADYLATRAYGIRYDLVSAPSAVAKGAQGNYQVKVTNTGNTTSNGWQLELHSVAAVPLYDGSGAVGSLMGSVAIPDGLAPGASTTLTVNATAPSTAGAWLVKADVNIGGANRPYLSQRGVVALQVPLTTQP
jgi:N-acetylmuramoyl-L-alanine amidase